MRDQAESLRLKMMQAEGTAAHSIAVISGKGGVGKTNFTTNFATALKKQGKRVIIVDMDIGMGNVHIMLGATAESSLKDYLTGERPLADTISRSPDGLDFISGGSGLESVLEWTADKFSRLIEAFEVLQQQYDYILFDMGAGASESAIELIVSVDEIIVIATPEPTSITDAYSMMKFICLRDPGKKFFIVSNRVQPKEDGNEAITRLQFAMRKFLNKETTILGALPEDAAVRKSVVAQKPFVTLFPQSPVSRRMNAIASNYISAGTDIESKESSTFLNQLKKLFARGRG
ncbi:MULTISPECIES: MinD/ParA family protein [Sporosarcina]|uniref:MinD/ParA family protein n=1 Tax=Sporosarcina TaxID=1569 RepID=UPI00058C8C63|nr:MULTISPECIES: MinD/ParA family protein [Sporosarcina]WJY28720.1 MinD/ParA family protein [Sporosarcina sp. 0.2-SM1T-5]